MDPAARTGPTSAAITYFVLGDEVMAHLVLGTQPQLIRRLCTAQALTSLLSRWEMYVGGHAIDVASRYWRQQLPACLNVLQELYTAVFSPLESLLPPTAGETGLCVVPHGLVHKVPFHALHDGIDHLIARFQITLAPSLSAAARSEAVTSRPGPMISVGVADERAPLMELEAAEVFALHANTSLGHLTAPGPDLLLTGPDATRATVTKALEVASVAHLACHGLFRAANPAFSGIQLSDGWLRAMDLAALDLHGSTVILGACESGRMEQRGGDEAVGLAAGALMAGARHVVVSSWLADDAVTRELMRELHLNLVAGHHPGQALRLAQITISQHHPHPLHWAPFIVVGAPGQSEV
jgi:CHAT domain-containing protein